MTHPTPEASSPEDRRRVRINHLPRYSKARALLRVLVGRPQPLFTQLQQELKTLTGTPANPVDWMEPDTWIQERLRGDVRRLAATIWTESGREVNPKHTRHTWRLARMYGLLHADSGGTLGLTERGVEFVKNQGGAAEAHLDEREGVLALLGAVAERGPARKGDLRAWWGGYLKEYSGFRAATVTGQSLGHRLRNLLDRGLVSQEAGKYAITEEGRKWLSRSELPAAPSARGEILQLARKCADSARDAMKAELLAMDPADFEQLVGRLLEAIGYQDVKVVGQSGDGGVDVIAELELGVSWVREVIQAKRHQKTIQRSVLDALRGVLYRFGAVRGTIVATSSFASGAKKAAVQPGAPPITLIDGEKLMDMLVEHGIGVRKESVELLTHVPGGLAPAEESDDE